MSRLSVDGSNCSLAPWAGAAFASGHDQVPVITASKTAHASLRAIAVLAGPGLVLRLNARCLGATSIGSSGRGGSSWLTSLRRSRLTWISQPVRPPRWRRNARLRSFSQGGEGTISARRTRVETWCKSTQNRPFGSISSFLVQAGNPVAPMDKSLDTACSLVTPPVGFEPTTGCLEGSCSIRLS